MHRLTVALLSAFDAAIAAAVGIAATLAPLTLLWVFGLGDGADWGALWPAAAKIWQFGHLVPLQITLPGEYLAATGIDPAAATFVLSLAPLGFAAFTAIFAARSGARASGADAWITGVLTGSVVFAALVALVALTSRTAVAEVSLWQALLLPALVFVLPAVAGAIATEWRDAARGVVARLRDRAEALPGGWGVVPGLSVRAGAASVVGLIGLGALALAVAVIAKGGEIVALYQAGNFDLLGAIGVTLAELAYLPTLVVWGMSFVAGPGFALGAGTAVSPAGTQLGVVPGVPVLGAVPESTTTWLLLLVLLPVGVGALAGWIARSRFVAVFAPPRASVPEAPIPAGSPVGSGSAAAGSVWAPTGSVSGSAQPAAKKTDAGGLDPARRAELAGLMTPSAFGTNPTAALAAAPAASGELAPPPTSAAAETTAPAASAPPETMTAAVPEPFLPRLVLTVAIALISAGAAALLAALASGSAGPGRLAEVGPQPGPVALAIGLEVALGTGILLLSGRSASRADMHVRGSEAVSSASAVGSTTIAGDASTAIGGEDADQDPGNAGVPASPPAVAPQAAAVVAPPAPVDPQSFPTVPIVPASAVRAPGVPESTAPDPDADTAPIPLPPSAVSPDQEMPRNQDDSDGSGL